MTDTFTWPTPPQFISPPGVSTAADKDCLIVLNDGQKLLGKLIRFSPEDSVLEYQPNRDTAVTSLPFASIKNLRLAHPLVLKKQADTLELKGGEVFPASEKQSCEVEFQDGGLSRFFVSKNRRFKPPANDPASDRLPPLADLLR